MNLQSIERVKTLSPDAFLSNHVNPAKPVVFTELSKGWPAAKKWDLDYFEKVAGDVEVPLYDSEPAKGKEASRKPAAVMPMKEYIQLLKKGPTDLRIFFLNVLKKCPKLTEDFWYPDVGLKFFKRLPVLFFGGEGSRVILHYDIDMANNLLFNLYGKKEIILFPQDEKEFLYHVPHSIVSIEHIEFDKPDFEKYPALKKAKGYRVVLKANETLFIPSGYWHFVRYLEPSISMSLRSFPTSFANRWKMFKNIAFMMPFDNLMRKLKGQKWIDYKNKTTFARTHKTAGIS